jgi:hypothetical protein
VPPIKTTFRNALERRGVEPRLAVAGEVTLVTICLHVLIATDFNA